LVKVTVEPVPAAATKQEPLPTVLPLEPVPILALLRAT